MDNMIRRHLALAVPASVILVLFTLSGTAVAQSDAALGARVFGEGEPRSVQDLPRGQLRSRLESLPPQAKARGLQWLQDFSFTEGDLDTLRIDDEGGVLFADFLLPTEPSESPRGAEAAALDAPQSTLDDAFVLHSRPGAPNVVFIDFDGHIISGTAWNSGGNTLYARAYDLDGDPNTFNSTERTRIVDIWHRVAEDLAPFDIDVTTEQPASFDRYTGRILVTRDDDQTGANMPSAGAGGVAYVGVFGLSNYHSYYSPALVYYDNLGGGVETYVAEASSHEFGHNLGLSHDGASGTTYYAGHGSGLVSWAPIMGNSYYNNVTQWSKGEYSGATQTQDDIAIIISRLGLKPDDHGNSISAGSPLFVGPDGSVVSSNPELDPHDELPENKGVINSAADVDVFTFTAGAGQVSLQVTPAWDAFYRATSRRGANLDVRAELRNLGGSLVAASDPTTDTMATVSATVAAGTYHLLISGVGNATVPYSDYDSLGQYFINGSVSVADPDTTPPTPNPMTWASPPLASGESEIVMTASVASDETSTVQYNFQCVAGGSGCANSGWQASNSHSASGLAAETSYTYTVVARDLAGNQTSASSPASATTDAPPPPPPYVDFPAQGDSAVAGTVSGSYTDTHSDNGVTQSIRERESGGRPNSRYTYLEHRWSFTVSSGMSVTVFANAWSGGSTDGDSFNFQYSLNGGGSWSPLFNVNSTSAANQQSAEIPGAPSGSILVRVVDTDQTEGHRQEDTIYVDHLYVQVANPPTDPPDGGPQALSASAVSSSQINLGWNDGATNETGYRVERSLNGSSGWVDVADLPADSTGHSDTGLSASTTYYYRVSAYNPNGSSPYANANATTDAPPPPPNPPSGLTANGVSSSEIDLAWSHSGTNEDGFRVERSAAGQGNWSVIATLGVNAGSYTDTGLPANTTFDYRVAAFNGSGQSYSTVASGTTDPAPALSLSASGYKVKGKHFIDLNWSGSNLVDVYRNGVQIAGNVSGSSYTDDTGNNGGGSYTHQVCEAGTSVCSNVTTTIF